MVKRTSRESARERKCSEDMSDSGKVPKKRSRYNLRDRGTVWVDDDTLDEPPPVILVVPADSESDSDSDSDFEEEEEEEEEFIQYLLDKYVSTPSSKGVFPPEKKVKGKKEEALPIKLTKKEEEYFRSQTSAKRKNLMDMMNRVSLLSLEDGVVPNKFKILELPISDYVKTNVIKKLDILEGMGGEGESYKLRNWVDAFLRIPFGKTVPLPVKFEEGQQKCSDFMVESRKMMDKSIYGMVPAKTQIMQIMAQWLVNPGSVGNVIALNGPMGVGKTSFAKNGIAHVLKRPFEFFSLGGASDIANFIGHSYTYEGSMWGRIADSLMKCGSMNPVLYFDELDKVSETPHGEEIISMLIHMTDRSQNSQFHDRYFSGVDFDLSQCLFVFSVNNIDKIHPILRDRMTVINCGGYTDSDKKIILKDFIWPQIVERLKFKEGEVTLADDAISYLITQFSDSEKGVRTLIRTVESMMTRMNMLRIVKDDSMKEYKFYMELQFPLVVTEKVTKNLLVDFNQKEVESWRTMYN
jgi:ATP-dependent Lon protease